LLARLHGVDPAADHIQAVEQPVDDIGIERELPGADFAEKVLGGVHQTRQRRDVEQSGRALQRMHRAENVVDDGLRVGILLEREHPGARLLQEFAGLGDELGEKRVHAVAPRAGDWPVIKRQWSASAAASTGLTM
jgi:hypothetical protein